MIDTSHIDPHWPVDAQAQAAEQPAPARPKGTARDLRRQLRQAPDVGREFAILRELLRRRQARTNTRKDAP